MALEKGGLFQSIMYEIYLESKFGPQEKFWGPQILNTKGPNGRCNFKLILIPAWDVFHSTVLYKEWPFIMRQYSNTRSVHSVVLNT